MFRKVCYELQEDWDTDDGGVMVRYQGYSGAGTPGHLFMFSFAMQ